MTLGAGMKRIRDRVRAVFHDAVGHLWTVAADERAREIVREVHARGDCHGPVDRIGAVADDEPAVGQDTGTWDPLAEAIAHVRVVEVEHGVGEHVREARPSSISADDLHLKYAAIRAVFRLNLHRQSIARARDDERFTRTVDGHIAREDETAMIRNLAGEHHGTTSAGQIEIVGRSSQHPVAHAKRLCVDCEFVVQPFHEKRAAHLRSRNDRVLTAGEPKHSEPAANASRRRGGEGALRRAHH